MKKIPEIKKDISSFLQQEEGRMSKEDVINLGTGITALSILLLGTMRSGEHTSYFTDDSSKEGVNLATLSPSELLAYHSSSYDSEADCHASHTSHSSHTSHTSHSSHASHASHTSHTSHTSHSSHASHTSHVSHTSHTSHTSHSSHASHTSHTSHASHTSHSSHASHASGCTCPFIILWNGKNYVLENNILPQSEDPNRKDLIVEDLYKFENNLVPESGYYKIRISEFEQEKTLFKNLKLIKVRHPKNITIGVVDNKIVAYKQILKPSKVLVGDDELDANQEVLLKKGASANLEFSNFEKDNYLLVAQVGLRGGKRRVDKAKEILQKNDYDSTKEFTKKALIAIGLGLVAPAISSGCLPWDLYDPKSVHWYLYLGEEEKKIAVTHPREIMSTYLFDFSSYINNLNDQLKVKVNWTDTHKVTPIGLAKKVSLDNLEINELNPVKIVHSETGSFLSKDLAKNGTLKPGETLTVSYSADSDDNNQDCTFLIKAEGYYEKY